MIHPLSSSAIGVEVPKTMDKKLTKLSVTITIPLDIAETLAGYISGGIGTSGDDEFSRQMQIVLNKIDKQISKHSFARSVNVDPDKLLILKKKV